MERSSPISIYYWQNGSHSLMTQCEVQAFGKSLGLFIHVPESTILIERLSSLQTIQVFDSEVIIRIAKKWKGCDTRVEVELILPNNRKFRYSVTELRMADSSILLDVSEDVGNNWQPVRSRDGASA